jgi:iron complex transport system ATP-binding protein
MDELLTFEHVTAGYRRKAILHDLSLQIRSGEMVAVLGPNGSGKTTLLRTVTGLCPLFSGQVRLYGRDHRALTAPERARLVAVVPQEVETPMPFTVEEMVTIGRTACLSRWSAPGAADRHAIERAMAFTDVVDLRQCRFAELSGGEKQRVIVAMALAQETRILLLDEATSHLDINHRLEVMQIVERLNRERGVTVVMISHDLNAAAEFCRRILLLDHGRVAADGPPEAVLTEALLEPVYHCDLLTHRDPTTGSITVTPAARLSAAPSGQGLRVHVIAGGGSGEAVLRRLCLCNYSVTCGVLNEGDSDTDVADALDIETVREKPFSPVSPERLETAIDRVNRSDVVILCGTAFGPGNLLNLHLAEHALQAGKPVYVMADIESRDFTTSQEATRRVRQLIAHGARVWAQPAELFRLLPVTKPVQDSGPLARRTPGSLTE